MRVVWPGLTLFLSACFVGDAPMIPDGQATVIGKDEITFCAEYECYAGVPVRDGYEVTNPDEPLDRDTVTLRFEPLWAGEAGQRVFLAEMSFEGEEGVMYLFARQRADAPTQIELRAPDCSHTDEATREQFNLTRTHGSCSAPDLRTLKSSLLHLYADDFTQPAFWRAED